MSSLRNLATSTATGKRPQSPLRPPLTPPCGKPRFTDMTSFQPRSANQSTDSYSPRPVLIGDALASALRALPHDRLRPIADQLEER